MTARELGSGQPGPGAILEIAISALSNGASSIATKRAAQRADYLLDTARGADAGRRRSATRRPPANHHPSVPRRPVLRSRRPGRRWCAATIDLDPSALNCMGVLIACPRKTITVTLWSGADRRSSTNLVSFHPRALLGEKVHARFGA